MSMHWEDHMKPQRIQLRRTKGWRKPEGVISVARPARWGNPFSVEQHGRVLAVGLFAEIAYGLWDPTLLNHLSDDEYRTVAYQRDAFTQRVNGHPFEMIQTELRGRDLACWCPLDVLCHADVLLEVANL